jgi:autotransporter-associated beta strand protein
VKNGTGKWLLNRTSTNSYTGTTTINDGTLGLVATSGTSNPISSSTKITLASSAKLDVTGVTLGFTLGSTQTLAGTGNVYGNVTSSNASSKVMPGDTNTPGTLTLNNNFTLSNGNLAIESDSSSFAMLTVSGAVTLGGGLQLKASYQPTLSTPIKILNKTSGGAITSTFAGLAQNAYFHPTSGNTGDWYKVSYTGGDGNDIVISREAVPEPSSVGMVALGAGVLMRRRRRSSSKPA